MRSILVFLRNASPSDVANFLTENFEYQSGAPWLVSGDQGARLYVQFDAHSRTELSEQGIDLNRLLGYEPTTVIAADVSGNTGADQLVRKFLSQILHSFAGKVQDDYSQHCWTLEEILSNRVIEGHAFFDYGR